MTQSNADPNENPIPFSRVLEDEFEQIHGILPKADAELGVPDANDDGRREKTVGHPTPVDRADANRVAEFYRHLHAMDEPQSALCLSGGGIRSATFSLGVLQGLARAGHLDKFHYLSSASGGGYTNAWLNALIKRKGMDGAMRVLCQGSAGGSAEDRGGAHTHGGAEPAAIQHVRAYSNYLTPRSGMMSADTWTFVAIVFRNLFLNWLVLVPAIAGLLIVPRLAIGLMKLPVSKDSPIPEALLGAGFLAAVFAIAGIFSLRSGAKRASSPLGGKKRAQAGTTRVLWTCVWPVIGAVACLILYWALSHPRRADQECWMFAAFGAAAHAGGLFVSIVVTKRFLTRDWFMLLAALLNGALVGVALYWVATSLLRNPPDDPAVYVAFAGPVLLLLFVVGSIVFNAFASPSLTDEDREWIARLHGYLLRAIVIWVVACTVVAYGPELLVRFWDVVVSVGSAAGVAMFIATRGDDTRTSTGERKRSTWAFVRDRMSALVAPVLLLILLTLVVFLTTAALCATSQHGLQSHLNPPGADWAWWVDHHREILVDTSPQLSGVVFLALAAFVALASWLIGVNTFSLHSVYRDRLQRAWLGASRCGHRNANPFTGFDPADDVRMHELQSADGRTGAEASPPSAGRRLFPVINMALNLVGSRNLAWQQRKAESFTATPLHCGSRHLGYRPSDQYGGGSRQPNGKQAGNEAISLATAIAISGAAASPAQGHHTSGLVAMLMSFFNVRLGWWLGNPGKPGKNTWNLAGPKISFPRRMAEALGTTNDKGKYVYLTDGGHFDNLGLYEMVQRRCRFITVIDGGADPECTLEDLGNAIRKIRIDLGVPIDMSDFSILTRQEVEEKGADLGRYCAIGTIRYSAIDPPPAGSEGDAAANSMDGILMYIKPALYGSEPRDVYNYSRTIPDFPHETTVDQWFSEAQFESYRALGQHVIEQICKSPAEGSGLAGLHEQAVAHVGGAAGE